MQILSSPLRNVHFWHSQRGQGICLKNMTAWSVSWQKGRLPVSLPPMSLRGKLMRNGWEINQVWVLLSKGSMDSGARTPVICPEVLSCLICLFKSCSSFKALPKLYPLSWNLPNSLAIQHFLSASIHATGFQRPWHRNRLTYSRYRKD